MERVDGMAARHVMRLNDTSAHILSVCLLKYRLTSPHGRVAIPSVRSVAYPAVECQVEFLYRSLVWREGHCSETLPVEAIEEPSRRISTSKSTKVLF